MILLLIVALLVTYLVLKKNGDEKGARVVLNIAKWTGIVVVAYVVVALLIVAING